jgi:uncharacterized membrane protein YidH (DUF202 family)
MTIKRTVGIVLIILGVIALARGGIFWSQNKNVVDIGSVKIDRQEHHGVALPPVLGIISLIGGIVLVAIPERSS